MKVGRTLRIARWETTKSVGSLDRRTAAALLVVLVLLGALVPILLAASPSPGAGLYRVGVDEGSPYYDVVAEDPDLQVVDPSGELSARSMDVKVVGTSVFVPDSEKGRAAAGALRESIISYNDRIMTQETDQAAAFPVDVTLRYLAQADPAVAGVGETDDGSQDGTDGGGGTDGSGGGSDGDGTGAGDDGQTGGQDGEEAEDGSGGPIPSAPIGGILGTTQTGTPSSIAPPFPLRSLLLAFLFLLPFNVIIQAYGSSVIAERINRRGEPLLVSPASRGDIVVGKALPYFFLSIAITTVLALAIGGGILSVTAVAPLAALFISATFVGGMLARSYKELTFVTVTISVTLTGYAFIPAVFAEVHPIAAISPLTLVVNDLQGVPVAPGEFVFATLPVTLAALVMLRLGTGIYREEDMFTQLPLPQKALDALSAPLRTKWHVGLWTGLFIPFVLVGELFAVAMLYILPVTLSIPLLLAVIALVEEVAKSIHVYAGFTRARFDRTLRMGLVLGAISGLGFFLAEKLLVITQLVGLPDLQIGQAAFAPEVLGVTPAVFLVAPLVLHTVTAAISAVGATRSRVTYLGTVLIATTLHVGYNLAVVSTLA